MTAALLLLALLSNPLRDSDLEQRVMKLSQQFRCLVCQNETIADSHADLAADLRQQIREQMIAGQSDVQITAFLTDRYGDFVLYRPRVTPKNYVLWFGPFLLLGGGMYWLYVFVKRWPRSRKLWVPSAEEHRRAEELLQFASDPNVMIYRDQFAEMESDFRAGFVQPDQYERDREELESRLLEDCRQSQAQVHQSRTRRRRKQGI
jgi:cytochrome c-type biogenesis protein CcmH